MNEAGLLTKVYALARTGTWLRLSTKCKFDFVDQVLVYLRQPASDVRQFRARRIEAELPFFDKMARSGDLAGRGIRSYRRRMAELDISLTDLNGFSETSMEFRQAFLSIDGKIGHALGVLNRKSVK